MQRSEANLQCHKSKSSEIDFIIYKAVWKMETSLRLFDKFYIFRLS